MNIETDFGKSHAPKMCFEKTAYTTIVDVVVDGLALCFLVRALVPGFYLAFEGYRLQGVLFPSWLVLVLLMDGRRFWNSLARSAPTVLAFACFVGYLIILDWANHGPGARTHLNNLYWSIPMYLFGCYYGSVQPGRFWFMAKTVLVILALQAAYSIPTLIANPFIAREMTHMDERSGAARLAFLGVGGYSLYLSNSLTVGFLIAFAIEPGKSFMKRLAWVVCCSGFCIANLVSSFTAASLLTIINGLAVICISLFKRNTRVNALILLAVSLVAGANVHRNILASSDSFGFVVQRGGSVFASVIADGLQADPTTRGERLFWSLKAWIAHPILGNGARAGVEYDGGKQLGGHSTWLDMLAEYGLLGWLCYVVVILCIGNEIRRSSRKTNSAVWYGLVAAYVSLLVSGLIDVIYPMRSFDFVLMFLVLGGALRLQTIAHCGGRDVDFVKEHGFMHVTFGLKHR